jgi:rod shape determining protein RodA
MIYSIVLISFFLFFYFRKKKNNLNNFPILSIGLLSIIFIFSVNFIFNSVFDQRHRDRFNVILGITQDSRGIGYNIEQSKIAIGSGGLSGKGFLQGTQTKGNFVPEQQTDYIFTTVGEEWGFIGGFGLIAIFVILIVRMLNQAEKQTNIFKRTIIYCIASIFFGHFTINIGMTLGLLPTIGIPLPFMSAGGSSLLTFSLFIFIYLNFDSNRLSDW